MKLVADHLGCTAPTLLRFYLKNMNGRGIQGQQFETVMRKAHLQKCETKPLTFSKVSGVDGHERVKEGLTYANTLTS